MKRNVLGWCLATAALVGGCGDGNKNTADMAGGNDLGAALTYVPFDTANLAAPTAQVAAVAQIDAITKAMGFGGASFGAFSVNLSSTDPTARCTPAAAPAAGTIAEQLLKDGLCQALTTTIQKHTYATGTGALGLDMNQRIVEAITAGATATDSVAAGAQGQWVKKTLVRFLYEGIYERLQLRTQKAWDEAYALWADKGLANTAKGRDTKFMTTFVAKVEAGFIAGRAALAKNDTAALAAAITEIDDQLTLMLGYASGSYFHKWITESTMRPLVYAEGSAFTQSIADYVKLKNPTGHSTMMTALAKTSADFTDTDSSNVAKAIETAFTISTQ